MPKDEQQQETKPVLLSNEILHSGPVKRDCAVGVRPFARDRVFARGAKEPQTRPGGLGYDM